MYVYVYVHVHVYVHVYVYVYVYDGYRIPQTNRDYKKLNNQYYLKAWEAHGGPRQPQDDPRKAQPGPKRV